MVFVVSPSKQKVISSGPCTFRPPVECIFHDGNGNDCTRSVRAASAPVLEQVPVRGDGASKERDRCDRRGDRGGQVRRGGGSGAHIDTLVTVRTRNRRGDSSSHPSTATDKCNNEVREATTADGETGVNVERGKGRVLSGDSDALRKSSIGHSLSSTTNFPRGGRDGISGYNKEQDPTFNLGSCPPSSRLPDTWMATSSSLSGAANHTSYEGSGNGHKNNRIGSIKDHNGTQARKAGPDTSNRMSSEAAVQDGSINSTLPNLEQDGRQLYGAGGASIAGWWPEAVAAVEDGARVDIYSGSDLDGTWLESLDFRLGAIIRATRR